MPPTGDCYRQAYDILMELHRDGDRDVHLVHGWVTNPNGRFVHAWVETQGGEYCIEAMAPDGEGVISVENYYRILRVEGIVRYSPVEARVALVRNGHFGPWHPSFEG